MQKSRLQRGPKRKISEEAWFSAATELIAIGGIDAVRVETMASKLGVTKGTFYVRFSTRDDFLQAFLDHWSRISTLRVIAELNLLQEAPLQQLEHVFTMSTTKVAQGRARVELALRSWAYFDVRPARMLQLIDEHRLEYFRSVLIENGVPAQHAAARAFLVYSYLISDALLPGDRDISRQQCHAFLAQDTNLKSGNGSLVPK